MRRANWPERSVLLVVAGIALVVTCFVLFEKREDIDLNSGRLRFQTAIGPLILSERIEETEFTRLLVKSDANDAANWHRANTKGVNRTHGRYGFAASELKRFAIVCDDRHIDKHHCCELGFQLLELAKRDEFEKMEKLIDKLGMSQSK
jgi:hypothetical protein